MLTQPSPGKITSSFHGEFTPGTETQMLRHWLGGIDTVELSSDPLYLADQSPQWLKAITILLCCIIFRARNSGGAWQVMLLFHVTLIEVAGWCAAGRGTGLEGPRQLHSCVWCLSWNVWKAGLSWDSGPECLHVTSPAWWPQHGGLRFLLQE